MAKRENLALLLALGAGWAGFFSLVMLFAVYFPLDKSHINSGVEIVIGALAAALAAAMWRGSQLAVKF